NVEQFVGREPNLTQPFELSMNQRTLRKQRQKLVAKIPHYEADSTSWKQKIYNAVLEAQTLAGIDYSDNVKLEVEVRFHLTGHKLTKLDLDNRLKQVGDALQGFINDKGGVKGARKRKPI